MNIASQLIACMFENCCVGRLDSAHKSYGSRQDVAGVTMSRISEVGYVPDGYDRGVGNQFSLDRCVCSCDVCSCGCARVCLCVRVMCVRVDVLVCLWMCSCVFVCSCDVCSCGCVDMCARVRVYSCLWHVFVRVDVRALVWHVFVWLCDNTAVLPVIQKLRH